MEKLKFPKYYKNLNRGEWAETKLRGILQDLPNNIASDIGSGYGWFGPIVKKHDLEWQPFDYVRKIKESTIWDLNNSAPENSKAPGVIIMLEVLEHLSNPELAIKNISQHINDKGYILLSTPNPFFARSKITMLFINNLYAFQPKHLIEHHVFVPLPHVVNYYFENNGFELLEFGVIGQPVKPKFTFNLNYFKAYILYFSTKLLGITSVSSRGPTQVFLYKKRN